MPPPRPWRPLPLLFVLLQLAVVGSAFRPLVNNFLSTDCYTNIISKLGQDCNDTANQVCIYEDGVLANPGRIFVTETACERLCGDGFGFWDPKDIVLRVFLWVVPAIVLIAHFHFPALPWWNYVAVVLHLLSDPVDTVWSMLVRIETYRFFYHHARDTRRYKSYRAIATVWSAYDEVGFQDASAYFVRAVETIRAGPLGRKGDFLAMRNEPPAVVGRSPTLPREGDPGPRPGLRARLGTIRNKLTPNGWTEVDVELLRPESPEEARVVWLIERAAQQLVSNRSESAFATIVAILGLVTAVGGAYVRTWSERLNNQTAHTIATVTLLFIVIPMVKLSGNIGAFTSSTAAVDIIQSLRAELGADYDLFPAFAFRGPDDGWDGSPSRLDTADSAARAKDRPRSLAEETREKLRVWPAIAAYSGMNASFRPLKYSKPGAHAPVARSRSLGVLLPVSVFLALVGCFLPALLISYFTPLQGFACRSLAWTLVAAFWTLSALGDRLFLTLRACRAARKLWAYTFAKDVFFTALIATLVICQQIGVYNSCWCRSGAMSNALRGLASYVNLTPLTDAQWNFGWWNLWLPLPGTALGINVVFLAVVEGLYSESRRLLNRGKTDREEGVRWINELVLAAEGKAAGRDAAVRGSPDGGGGGAAVPPAARGTPFVDT